MWTVAKVKNKNISILRKNLKENYWIKDLLSKIKDNSKN